MPLTHFRQLVQLCRMAALLTVITHFSSVLIAAQDSSSETDEFRDLFNGEDLTGWIPVNVAPETFTVQDQMIICSGKPTGVLRSERQYENFILELEWRHMRPGGNAGLFVWSYPLTAVGVPFTRSVEVQILDGLNTDNYTSHGDVFPIHGASFTPDRAHPNGWQRCLPIERRCNPSPEWNHYRVTCRDGTIQLAVNGKVVSGGTATLPRKGYICLESEGGLVHFRNLRIKELPSSRPETKEIAPPAEGFRTLYNGVSLDGWTTANDNQNLWQVNDWKLVCQQHEENDDQQPTPLWTIEEFTDFELICDWRWTGKPQKIERPIILDTGHEQTDRQGIVITKEVMDAGDSGIILRGHDKSQINIWCWPVGSGGVHGYRIDKQVDKETRAAVTPAQQADNAIGEWNRFRIRLKGEHVTVTLNGKRVVDRVPLPDLPRHGPIGLLPASSSIEFANIYIKELTPSGE